MSNLNTQIKEKLAVDVLRAAEWAHMVHENTMALASGFQDGKELEPIERARMSVLFNLDEREEARKIILEYGLGKPPRIIEHRGSKKDPICFTTRVVDTQKQLQEPASFIEAEFTNA